MSPRVNSPQNDDPECIAPRCRAACCEAARARERLFHLRSIVVERNDRPGAAGVVFSRGAESGESRALPGRQSMQLQNKTAGEAQIRPGAGVEIEIKLCGEPDSLKRAFSGAPIRDRATGRAATKRLDNVYYDTDDQRLRARGLAFRAQGRAALPDPEVRRRRGIGGLSRGVAESAPLRASRTSL